MEKSQQHVIGEDDASDVLSILTELDRKQKPRHSAPTSCPYPPGECSCGLPPSKPAPPSKPSSPCESSALCQGNKKTSARSEIIVGLYASAMENYNVSLPSVQFASLLEETRKLKFGGSGSSSGKPKKECKAGGLECDNEECCDINGALKIMYCTMNKGLSFFNRDVLSGQVSPTAVLFLGSGIRCLADLGVRDLRAICGGKEYQGFPPKQWLCKDACDWPLSREMKFEQFVAKYFVCPLQTDLLQDQIGKTLLEVLAQDCSSLATAREQLCLLCLQHYIAAVLNAKSSTTHYRFPVGCLSFFFSEFLCQSCLSWGPPDKFVRTGEDDFKIFAMSLQILKSHCLALVDENNRSAKKTHTVVYDHEHVASACTKPGCHCASSVAHYGGRTGTVICACGYRVSDCHCVDPCAQIEELTCRVQAELYDLIVGFPLPPE